MTKAMIERVSLTKLDVARRQLDTALELWFGDRDPVSVHTLAMAAYEVIDTLNKLGGDNSRLLFNSDMIKDEYRRLWVDTLRKDANFFKHADRDHDATLDFAPATNDFLFMFAILGLSLLHIKPSRLQSAFMFWLMINRPSTLKPDFAKRLTDYVPVEDIEETRGLPKPEFLAEYLKYHRDLG
jgi:hypothetical protein